MANRDKSHHRFTSGGHDERPETLPEDLTVFVGVRVADAPIPYMASDELRCENCDAPIWAAKPLVPKAIECDQRMCQVCAKPIIDDPESTIMVPR